MGGAGSSARDGAADFGPVGINLPLPSRRPCFRIARPSLVPRGLRVITWKRFWVAVLGWSTALGALLGAHALIDHFTTDTYRGPGAAVLALHAVAREIGLFLPLVVFCAALGSRPARTATPTVGVRCAEFAAAIVAGAIGYVWLAFVEPWTRVATFLSTARAAGATLDPPPVASTPSWLTTQISNPAVGPEEARFFAWLFHLPIALGLLTALLGIAGFLMTQRISTTAQRWTMAAFVSVVIAPMLLTSLRLSNDYGVPAGATTYGMLLPPLFLLGILGWVRWTDGGSPRNAAKS